MKIYNRTEYKELTPSAYSKEKKRIQVELLKLQEYIIKKEGRVAIVLEGRDAAGKGATIKRFIENMIPKSIGVIELGVPSKKQEKHWFQTWKSDCQRKGKSISLIEVGIQEPLFNHQWDIALKVSISILCKK